MKAPDKARAGRLGLRLIQLAVLGLLLLGAWMTYAFSESSDRVDALTRQVGDLRVTASMQQQDAEDSAAQAAAVEAAVRQANRKLKSLGAKPVPIPSPGAQGLPGPAGTTGSTGATGPTGPTGPAGMNGADGASGADGTDGTGTTGPQGPAGQDGSDGQDGADGQPPASWSYSVLGIPYTCTRVADFDPAAPRYECSADAP